MLPTLTIIHCGFVTPQNKSSSQRMVSQRNHSQTVIKVQINDWISHYKYLSMKRFFPVILLFTLSCNNKLDERNLDGKIKLNGKTFVFHPEKEKEVLTVQFMDSTCNLFELNQYNQPWRIVDFENSTILVLGHMTIPIYKENDSTIIGLSIGERDFKLKLEEKRPKWNMDKILGKWTEEQWVGVENSKIPPPPASIPDRDTIWPPFYEIGENKIINYCLGIDSTEIQMDNSRVYFNMNKAIHNDFVGYQKNWKILSLSDSVMTIERRYTKEFHDQYSTSYLDSVETVRLIKIQ